MTNKCFENFKTSAVSSLLALMILLTASACETSQKREEATNTKQVTTASANTNQITASVNISNQSANKMNPKILTTLAEVTTEIKQSNINQGLQLNIADELWRDSSGAQITGVNMSIITDAVLERGLFPDGFEQKQGYRIYRYKKAN